MQILRKNFYLHIPGTYSGFYEPIFAKSTETNAAYAGFVMDITDVDSNGYFIGELVQGEIESTSLGQKSVRAGVFQLHGKINYEFYFKKKKDPFNVDKNSKYFGKLSVVDRLDFFKGQKIEDFLSHTFDITYYREMKSLSFYNKIAINEVSALPEGFTLDKKRDHQTGLFHDVFGTVIRGNNLFSKSFRTRNQ